MKKYWIKDLTDKQVIHAPTEDIAEKLCKKFHELGLKWRMGNSYSSRTCWHLSRENTCYRPAAGVYGHKVEYNTDRYEILTIGNLLDFEETKTFPRKMLVWGRLCMKRERIVLHKLEGKAYKPFITVYGQDEKDYLKGESYDTDSWAFAEEIPEPEKMTLEQVRKELGRDIIIVE